MSVPDHETLTQEIDGTRITYPTREHGVGISGSPFICRFMESVDPREFCEDILTADEPWRMFGVKTRLAGAETDSDGTVVNSEYWKVVGNLFHITDGDLDGVSPISLEVTSEWIRVYVKDDCSASRAAEFVQTLDAEYDITVEFVDATERTTGVESHE